MSSIEVIRAGDHVVVRLHRPPVNALDIETLDELSDTFDALTNEDPDAVVLTGTDLMFSAGADLRRVLKATDDEIDQGIVALARAFRTLFCFPRPLVAAVNGHALAGGAIIASTADYKVMVDSDATIGAVELAAGVPFPAWALEPLRFATNNHHFQEIAITGRAYNPQRALEVGLVDEIVPAARLEDRAAEVAEELARVPRRTFSLTKSMVRAPSVERADRTGELTDKEVKEAWRSAEVREAVRRTLEALRGV